MADDGVGVVLVFVQKVGHTREGYLVDVFVYLFLRHTHTAVAEGQRAFLRVYLHVDGQVAQLALEVALGGQRLQLLGGVHGVGYHLTEKNLMVRVQKLLDYREYVLCRYTYVSFLHNLLVLYCCLFVLMWMGLSGVLQAIVFLPQRLRRQTAA